MSQGLLVGVKSVVEISDEFVEASWFLSAVVVRLLGLARTNSLPCGLVEIGQHPLSLHVCVHSCHTIDLLILRDMCHGRW